MLHYVANLRDYTELHGPFVVSFELTDEWPNGWINDEPILVGRVPDFDSSHPGHNEYVLVSDAIDSLHGRAQHDYEREHMHDSHIRDYRLHIAIGDEELPF